MYSCVAFRYLTWKTESLIVWLYYITFICCLMAISRRQLILAQASRPLGWPVCTLNAPSSLPGANAWSLENLHHQPIGDLFRSWFVLSLARQGCLTLSSTHCITALHGLQINCTTLKWLPSAGHTQTWPCALFSRQKLLDILISVIW